MKRADEASKSKTIGNLVASFQRQVLTLLVKMSKTSKVKLSTIGNLVASFQRQVLTLLVLLILLVSLVQEHLLAGTKGQILTPEAGRAAVPDDH